MPTLTPEQLAGWCGALSSAVAVLYGAWRYGGKSAYTQCRGICAALLHLPAIAAAVAPAGLPSLTERLETVSAEMAAMKTSIHLQAQRHRAVLADSRLGYFEAGPAGAWSWVSRTLAKLTGRTPEESLGRGFANAICPKERHRVVQGWEDAVEEGREWEEECDFCLPYGARVRVRIRAFPLLDGAGDVVQYLGIVQQADPSTAVHLPYATPEGADKASF